MNNTTLNEIEDRCCAASSYPWVSYIEGRDCYSGSSFIMTGSYDNIDLVVASDDQDFIAHSRQDIQYLIEEIRLLINENRSLGISEGYLKIVALRLANTSKDFDSITIEGGTEADLKFIRHAREDIVFLLKEIEKLRKIKILTSEQV